MTFRFIVACFLLLSAGLPAVASRAKQDSATTSSVQAEAYPNTPDGLQKQIDDILRAAKEKNAAKETDLIHSLVLPKNSAWFMNEYGPGFGASLAAAYARALPGLEQEIKTIYEGNVDRGWMTPKLLRYENPDTTDAPIDRFLNCMNKIVPLYQSAFHDGRTSFYMSLKPGENGKHAAGDLDGFFVYDQGGFRFIPMNVLMKLPSERPIRIKLDTNVMNSKLLTTPNFSYPEEAIRKHISGKVVIHIVIDTQGNIKEPKAVQGDPILSGPVMDDMKKWRFEPTMLDGDPVEVEVDWGTGFEYH
jgi:TonB family protein